MPELPEVETVALQLAPQLRGCVARRVAILDPRLRHGRLPRLAGRAVAAVSRCGKQVLIEFTGAPGRRDPLWLAIHLRMTGRLIWLAPGEPRERDHLRARLGFDRGELRFYDARRFGTFRWLRSAQAAAPAGLDPLSAELTPQRLGELARGSTQNVKAWLLRQDRLVGIGNIYASEILHAARIAPFRAVGSLDDGELRRLHAAIGKVLLRAISYNGTTFSDFQDSRGVEGGFGRLLAVYDREGRPCRRCRAPVRRVVQGQRSTFHCAGCQR